MDRATGTSSAGGIDVWFFAARAADHRLPRPPFAWLPEARLPGLRFPDTNRGVLAQILESSD